MRQPITSHLPDRPPEEDVEAWRCVEATLQTVGWQEFIGAVDARVDQLQAELLGPKPREGDERTIGEMRGLRSIEGIIYGLKARAEEANR